MAIAVTVPTASWNASVGTGVDITSGSFNTTTGSILVVAFEVRDSSSNAVSSPVCSDSFGLGITWTLQKHLGWVDNARNAYAALYTSTLIGSVASGTISLHCTQGSGGSITQVGSVYQVTGQAVSFIGNTGSGQNTTANADLAIYTSSANNSRGFMAAADDNALTPYTSSNGTLQQLNLPGVYTYLDGYLNADTPGSGTGVTFNVNSGGSAPSMNWVAIEILPGAAATPPAFWHGFARVGP